MERISEWARTVTILVIIAAIADVLFPDENFRRFGRFVTGLMIIAAVIYPFLDYLGSSAHLEQMLAYVDDRSVGGLAGIEGAEYYAQARQPVELDAAQLSPEDLLERSRASAERRINALMSLIPGVSDSSVRVTYDRDGVLKRVEIDLTCSTSTVQGGEGRASPAEKARRLVSDLWGIDSSIIAVNLRSESS